MSPVPPDLAGRRVLVWGFGRHGGGQAAARFCASQGARIAILDRQGPEAFAAEGAAALAAGWEWSVGDGGHAAVAAADLVVASPAIPPRAWPARHPPRTSPEALFFAVHRGPCVGVTGTKGKSTTVRILATLLGWAAGGNSYDPLLAVQERVGADAPLVCELSSFQLWYLAERPPRLAASVLTSLAVDHLDWHPDAGHYRAAKRALLAWGAAVAAHPGDADGSIRLPAFDGAAWRLDGRVLAERGDLPIPGDHMAANATLAIATALHLGLDPALVGERLRRVVGLPHRLQTVRDDGRLRFVDDSIATTPDSAMCALRSFAGPLAVILGGSDKGADFAALARLVAERGARPVLIGATAPRIAAALDACGVAWKRAADMPSAVTAAVGLLPEGGTVLLSPACASFDMFQGFEDRGRRFAAAVGGLSPR